MGQGLVYGFSPTYNEVDMVLLLSIYSMLKFCLDHSSLSTLLSVGILDLGMDKYHILADTSPQEHASSQYC